MKKFMLHAKTGLVVSFEEDEGDWVVAEVPLLPGCISQGHGFLDAAQNISTAIDDYLGIIKEEDPHRHAELISASGTYLISPSVVSGEHRGVEHNSTSRAAFWDSDAA